MKTRFQGALKKCIMQKDFWFQNLKPTSKEILFSKGKLFQSASLSCKKKKGFCFKKKTPSEVCCFKNPCLKKKSFPNWFLNLLYKILGA
jgi:hypothetical protein